MKRVSIRIVAIAATFIATAVSCKMEAPEEAGTQVTITATMEQGTKTVLRENSTQVLWQPGDEVKVFYGTGGSRFTSVNTENAATASFTGMLSYMFGSNEGAEGGYQLLAVYPYSADATSDGSTISTTLPAEQVGKAGSFAPGQFITVSRSDKLSMTFYNVCGGVRFSLDEEGIDKVTFRGNGGEILAGDITIGWDGESGLPTVTEAADTVTTLTLTAPYGETLTPGEFYYITALPRLLASGFKMTFSGPAKRGVLNFPSLVTIQRGVFGSLSRADKNVEYEPIVIPINPADAIAFRDMAAKYACVEKFDTNGDGEVSYEEAAAATSISGLFTDWNSVTSFDELKYFTSLTSIGTTLRGLTSLKSVTIPDQITSIPNNSFDGCTALDSLTLSSGLTAIGSSALHNCTALEELDIPNGVTSIGNNAFQGCINLAACTLPSQLTSLGTYAFDGCSKLTGIVIPSGVTAISARAFQNCSSLAGVQLPGAVTTIGEYAFSGCGKLASIDIPNGVTTINRNTFASTGLVSVVLPNTVNTLGTNVFENCTSLTTATLPSGLTSVPNYTFSGCKILCSVTFPDAPASIGDYAFNNCPFFNPITDVSKVELPATVTTIGNNCFNRVRNVIVPSTTNVSISANTFGVYTKIYVPSNKVEPYKIRTNWMNFAERIFAIDSYSDSSIYVAVDLGLSVKWATMNVGAFWPEEYGDYYAWGETEPKSDYSWSTYFDSIDGSGSNFTKYFNGEGGKTVLDLEDDVAHVKWGGDWRMPTDAEWTQLRENCTWTWTTLNGVKGRLVTSNVEGYTDRSIFLPAAGYRYGTSLYYAGSNGYYWSSSLTSDYSGNAWTVYFYSSYVYRYSNYRYYGRSVRPVSE